MDQVLSRFVEECPVAVMARLGLERALSCDWVNETFERFREKQYTRELLFSTVVDLMGLVALGQRPSLNAAAQKDQELCVSLAALYEKVNHTEPGVVRALVQGSSERLTPVVRSLNPTPSPVLSGYRVASSMGITCRPARNGLVFCAGFAEQLCRAIRSSSTSRSWIW